MGLSGDPPSIKIRWLKDQKHNIKLHKLARHSSVNGLLYALSQIPYGVFKSYSVCPESVSLTHDGPSKKSRDQHTRARQPLWWRTRVFPAVKLSGSRPGMTDVDGTPSGLEVTVTQSHAAQHTLIKPWSCSANFVSLRFETFSQMPDCWSGDSQTSLRTWLPSRDVTWCCEKLRCETSPFCRFSCIVVAIRIWIRPRKESLLLVTWPKTFRAGRR